ncbi:AraC family transcriptional regulator [Saccharibacillus sacchari]|uniref:AraC family transcriptional regulator n=1 Tax=Saccharibacillus sacchari TaxID=456493 RepID=A0ACC6PIG8_9BACL
MDSSHHPEACEQSADERLRLLVPRLLEASALTLSRIQARLRDKTIRGYMLLVPIGQAHIRIIADGIEQAAGAGSAMALNPGTRVESCVISAPENECYVLGFELLQRCEPEPAAGDAHSFHLEPIADPPLLAGVHRDTEGFVWSEAAALLCRPLPASAGMRERLLRQTTLSELAVRLGEREYPATSGKKDSREAVARTLAYMRQSYREPITRAALADRAGLSVWHYAELFKQMTGDSPIRHLNKLRIEAAKRELLLGSSPIQAIAKQSGFEDEYYFSRKFSELSGVSPSRCRSEGRRRLASVNFAYTGQLLALGAVPRAAVLDPGRDVHRRAFFDRIPVWLRRAEPVSGEVVDYNLERLRLEEPGILLCSEWEERICRERLPDRVPIAVVPWSTADWRGHLSDIAYLLGLSAQRKRWMDAYERQVDEVGRGLRRKLGGATVALLRLKADRVEVYGARNGGGVLFEDLGLNPAYRYRDIPISRSVPHDGWHAYAGQINLVIVDPGAAAQACWMSMLGENQGRRYIRVGEMPWLDYSAHAHRQIVAEANRLLGDEA